MNTIDDILKIDSSTIKKEAEEIVKELYTAIMEANRNLARPNVEIIDFEKIKEELHFDIIGTVEKIAPLADESLKLLQDKLSEYIGQLDGKLSSESMETLRNVLHNTNMETAQRNPWEGFITGIDSYKKAAEDAKAAQMDLDTIMSGGTATIEKYDDETGKTTKSILTLAEAEQNLIDAEKAKKSALAEASKAVNQTGKYGSESVNAGEGVSGMLKNFGVDVPEFVDGALSGLGQVMDGMASIDLTNPVSMIKGISTAIVGLGNFVASMVDAGDFVKEQEIKKIQKEVDKLTESYSSLQDAISKAYSTDKASLIQESNENLENQKRLIQEQMDLENEKKKTDDEKVKAYQQELDNINKQIEANNEAWQVAITGVSFDSFRQSFLSTLLDMNSDAEDFANNLEKYLQKAVLEAMITDKKYNEAIENLYASFSDKMRDGLTEDEINTLRKMQEELATQMLNDRDALAETFGWKNTLDESVDRTAGAAKGIAQASQESVDELNGRMTAMQEHTYSLMENTKILVDNSASMLERLCSIDINTAQLSRDIHSMNAQLNQMTIQGIRIAM